MRILFLVSQFYPHEGGVEEAAFNLGKSLQSLGHEVLIVTAHAPRSLPSREYVQGLAVTRIYLALPFTSFLSTLAFPIFSFVSVFKISRLIRKEEIDVLNLHFVDDAGFYALLVKFITGVKLVVSLHGNDVEKFPVESSFRRWLLRQLLNSAEAVTVNSHYLEEKLAAVAPFMSHKVQVIGNGVNLQEFTTLHPFQSDRPYILFLGRLVQKKGIDILLGAWAKIQAQFGNYDLLIAGDGEEGQNLKNLATQLEISDRVKFLCKVAHHHGLELMAGASLFVIPSRQEPFGIVALEAMAAGCPVLASKIGGLREIIEDGQNGVFFKSESIDNLANYLINLLGNKSKLEGLTKSAMGFVQGYSWDRVARKYLDEYQH